MKEGARVGGAQLCLHYSEEERRAPEECRQKQSFVDQRNCATPQRSEDNLRRRSGFAQDCRQIRDQPGGISAAGAGADGREFSYSFQRCLTSLRSFGGSFLSV